MEQVSAVGTTSAGSAGKLPLFNGPEEQHNAARMALELRDGSVHHGFSFGADRSIAGELVFQTGMVGYPESITDPSYKGQILVMTFPLVGNYGVPSRETMDNLLNGLPAHFEASQIHVAGLVVASYAGEEYSHYLAKSSLGTWLKEQNTPAMYGVDTRALTKKIRQQGSMLGRLLLEKPATNGVMVNGCHDSSESHRWKATFEDADWFDPNNTNLVEIGKVTLKVIQSCIALTSFSVMP